MGPKEQGEKITSKTVSLTISLLLSSSLSASFSYSRLFFRSLISQFLRRYNRRKKPTHSNLENIKNSSTYYLEVSLDYCLKPNALKLSKLVICNLKRWNKKPKVVLIATYIFCPSSCIQKIKKVFRKRRCKRNNIFYSSRRLIINPQKHF